MTRTMRLITWMSVLAVARAAQELTPETYKELTTSGKNGMIKFVRVLMMLMMTATAARILLLRKFFFAAWLAICWLRFFA
jgi:hypothetical protein